MDGDLRPLTIVGVVGDVREESLERPPSPIIYVNYASARKPLSVLRPWCARFQTLLR